MRLLRNYVFWSYERGSLHYDVMVTLILLFLFVGPVFINFRDKPVAKVPLRSSEVLVREIGDKSNEARFIYEIRLDDLGGAVGDAATRAAMLRVIQPIAGNVSIESYKPLMDSKGHIVAYDVTVLR